MRRHRCILREAEDISAFLYQASGMIPGYTQYSPGAANLAYDVLELEGVTLLWARNQAHCRWQDQMSDNGHVHFGFALSAETGVLSMGRALGATDAMLFLPRQEMDYVFLGPVQTLEVAVHGDLVDALGWRFRGSPLARLRAQPLERVKALSARAHALSRARGRMASTPRAVELRDALLDALEDALSPWLLTDGEASRFLRGTAGYWLLRKLEELVESGEDIDGGVASMAAEHGIGRRSLFYAFRNALGLTPRRYLEVRRLHALRRALEEAEPGTRTVTELATGLGFGDTGRLARRYREQFGENPSATLRR